MKKGDKLWLGLVIGFIAPIFGILGFYFWKASANEFSYFLKTMLQSKPFLTTVVSFSLLANAILFTIFVNTRRDKTAKGIFAITVIYAIAALIYKFTN